VNPGKPSRTALATAAARAAHLVVDSEPRIFADTLAHVLLGDHADALIGVHRVPESAAVCAAMRVAMTTRSRYCEQRLSEAFARGIRQCVLLGAGLDSLAFRSPAVGALRVFEVDHPATQAWKRERLAAAAIPVAPAVIFVPVDFTVDSLRGRLEEGGFDWSRPAFVTWIGVTQYLAAAAIGSTLDVLGDLAPGSELVVEYLLPEEMRDEGGQAMAAWFMHRAAASGEPWLTFLTTREITKLLHARDLKVVEDVGRRDQVDHSLWHRSDALRPHELGRLARAAKA
jgi:methyltransferase (TIGR00027 family)